MGDQKTIVRVAGHVLLNEGAAYTAEGTRMLYRPRLGHGKCSCGEVSPLLSSSSARKRWHRTHKTAIREAGA